MESKKGKKGEKKAENNFCLNSTYQPRESLRFSVSFLETAYTTNHLKQ